jgi:hypothetical protein
MSGLAYLGVAVAMAVVLSTLFWLVRRTPTSFLSSIDEFQREMDALGREPGSPPLPRSRGRAGGRPDPIVPAPRRGDLARKLRAARHEASSASRPDQGR